MSIEAELERLVELKGKDNWQSSTRNRDLYEVVERQYSFGTRRCYKQKTDSDYVNLQSSRSLCVEENDELEKFIKRAEESMAVKPTDFARIQEVEFYVPNKDKVVELGFRHPILLEYYKGKYGSKVKGYDIVPISIMVGQKFGYDVQQYDLSKCEGELDIGDANLILCYHVLEHITDPMVPIKKVYDTVQSGCFFHVEVPIEPVEPQLKVGHLFPFQSDDLKKMLEEVGFEVVSKKTITTHSWAERFLAKKP